MITKLCEMAQTYHTDKAGWYTPFYDLLFSSRRFEVSRILEVGIGTRQAMEHVPVYLPGASLFMWHDYFPNAEVWGVDSDKSSMTEFESIHSVHSDSTDLDLASKLPSEFDIIVDDGSHEVETQFQTFLNLYPLLKPGGLYIVEDAEGYSALSGYLEGYTHHIVLSPIGRYSGKMILIRK